MSDEFYMNLLLNYAWKYQALALPNPCVGAMILDKYNAIITLTSHNCFGTAHAELEAYKSAYIKLTGDKTLLDITNPFEIYDFLVQHHNGIFYDTSLFVSLEPCAHIGKTPSCARLISILKPKRVVISALDFSKNASGGANMMREHNIEVISGILKKQGNDLLFPFLCMQKKGSFLLYKVAKRLNGSFNGGTISSLDSRIYTHKIRSVIDRIIISQKTICTDNPLLDARLVNGKAPDVAILGRKNNLSSSQYVFSIPYRKVEFFSDISLLPICGFSMIEGGGELFNVLCEKIDCLLLFVAPNMQVGANFHSEFNGRILHSFILGGDVVLWIQKN